MSKRSQVIAALSDQFRRLRNGSYHIHRGPVNWGAWDWEKHPRAVAVMEDVSPLLLTQDRPISAQLALELALRTEDGQFSDETQDAMTQDVREALIGLLRVTTSGGNLVHSITEIEVTAMTDATIQVQGIIVTFTAKY